MTSKNLTQLPLVLLACAVFKNLLENMLPDDLASEVTFLDYGLHSLPKNLKVAVQERLDAIEEPSLVILGYGLCGNGLDGIQAGKHTLLIPRADDCIAIFLGSYAAYRREFDNNPGTYYLTKGWLESGSDPLREYEKLVDKYGRETADWLMHEQYQHYKRLVFVAHTQDDLEKYAPRARQVVRPRCVSPLFSCHPRGVAGAHRRVRLWWPTDLRDGKGRSCGATPTRVSVQRFAVSCQQPPCLARTSIANNVLANWGRLFP